MSGFPDKAETGAREPIPGERGWLTAADYPGCGPHWRAAIEYGIDVSLLERNLELTPTERLEQLEAMLEDYRALRAGDGG
jgi:hypothetical protein